MSFTLDGIEWEIPCKIERTAEVRPSEISGQMMDKSYFNDVIGTYMRYTIGIAVPFGMEEQYETLYEAISDPVDGHTLVVPYNRGTITITGRIESVSDVYVRMPGEKNYWRNTSFEILSNAPTKEMGLEEVLTRGRTPLPDLVDGEVGDTWIYAAASGWVHTNYPDYSDSYW